MSFTPQGLLADRLRLAREAKGWSQAELASHADVLQPQISKLEKALINEPGFFTIKKLSDALDVSLEDFASLPTAATPLKAAVLQPVHMEANSEQFAFGTYEDETGNTQTAYMDRDSMRSHTFVTGRTGSGKSILLQNVSVGMLDTDTSLLFVDPQGELTGQLIADIAKKEPGRVKDIVLVDFTNPDVSFNPLDISDTSEIEPIVHAMMEALSYAMALDGSRAPRAMNYLQQAVSVLCEANTHLSTIKCTVADIVRFFTDAQFRHLALNLCSNPAIRDAYDPQTGPFEMLSDKQQIEHVMPILRAFQPLGNSKTAGSILTHSENKLSGEKLLVPGAIVIVKCSSYSHEKGVGMLLTQMLLSQLYVHLQSRKTTHPVRIVLDEAHTILHETGFGFLELLARGRKQNVGFVVSSQFPNQFSANIMQAIYANTANKIVFSLDPPAMSSIVQTVDRGTGVLQKSDIASLPMYRAYVNVLTKDRNSVVSSGPFKILALPPITQDTNEQAEKVVGQTTQQKIHQAQDPLMRRKRASELQIHLIRLIQEQIAHDTEDETWF